jgi:hypothetical protein
MEVQATPLRREAFRRLYQHPKPLWSAIRGFQHNCSSGTTAVLAFFGVDELRDALLRLELRSYDRFISKLKRLQWSQDCPEAQAHIDAYDTLHLCDPSDKLISYAIDAQRTDLLDAWLPKRPGWTWLKLMTKVPGFSRYVPILLTESDLSTDHLTSLLIWAIPEYRMYLAPYITLEAMNSPHCKWAYDVLGHSF